MATTIKLKNSVTTTNAPSSLVQGEVAINITDKKVWVGNAATTPIQLLGDGGSVNFTTVDTTNLQVTNIKAKDGTASASIANSTGAFTVAAAFAANGGATLGDASGDALTINSSAVSIPNGMNFDSNTFVIDAANNRVGIGTSSPGQLLTLNATLGSGFASLTSATTPSAADQRLFGIGAGSVTDTLKARINFFSSAAWTDGVSTPTYISFATTPTSSTTPTERMRIDSSGLVGIGTSSPNSLLVVGDGTASTYTDVQIKGASTSNYGPYQAWLSAGTKILEISNFGRINGGTSTDSFITTVGSLNLLFGTNRTERMRIDSSGNVGIGTSSPSQTLDIRGSTTVGTKIFGIGTNSNAITLVVNSAGNLAGSYNANTAPVQGVLCLGAFTSGDTAYSLVTRGGAILADTVGNVGIGTSSPAVKLEVNGTGELLRLDGSANQNRQIYLRNVGTGTAKIHTDGTMTIGSNDVYPLTFITSDAERMRITSSGDLLVGKTSATTTTVGTQLNSGGKLELTLSASTNATDTLDVYSTGASAYRFYVQMDGKINATNTTIAAISDIRLKENIQDIDVGLNAVMALKPRKFDWKTGKGKNIKGDRGWIAQEFEQVFPDMIGTWKDEPPEGEEPYKSVAADLIPVLVKAIQEQQAMIEELKQEVALLKAK